MPGVAVLHGYAGNLEMLEAPLALDLARRGMVVLAIDYNGHGRSGGGIRSLASPDGMSGEHALLEESLRLLKSQPDVDPERLGLIGHSDGASTAAETAESLPAVRATAYISGPPDVRVYARATGPSNLLVVQGTADPFTRPDVPEVIADEPWLHNPGHIEGDLAAGTGRKRVLVQGGGHMSILYDTAARRAVVDWMTDTLRAERRTPVSPLPLRALLVAVLGILAFTSAVLTMLRRACFDDVERVQHWPRPTTWRALAAVVAGGAAVRWSLTALEPVARAAAWVPVSTGALVLASEWTRAMALLAVFACLQVGIGKRAIGQQLRRATVSDMWARVVLFALVPTTIAVFGLAVVLRGYYDIPIVARRAGLFLVLAVALWPPCAMWQVWLAGVAPARLRSPTQRTSFSVASAMLYIAIYWRPAALYFQGAHMVFLLCIGMFLCLAAGTAHHVRGATSLLGVATLNAVVSAAAYAAFSPFTT
jgi:dienelactone hydrolase